MVVIYSIIQWFDDPERRETLNVGLLAAEGDILEVRLVQRDELHEAGIVDRFRATLENIQSEERRRAGRLDAPRLLRELAVRRFPHFQFTEPRQADAESVASAADELTRQLVETPLNA